MSDAKNTNNPNLFQTLVQGIKNVKEMERDIRLVLGTLPFLIKAGLEDSSFLTSENKNICTDSFPYRWKVSRKNKGFGISMDCYFLNSTEDSLDDGHCVFSSNPHEHNNYSKEHVQGVYESFNELIVVLSKDYPKVKEILAPFLKAGKK